MSKNLLSKDKIDKYKTYELFFQLFEDEECLQIEIISTKKIHKFTKKKSSDKIFFIIEKIIETTNKSGKINKNYSEIGRNFDNDWNRQRIITICSIKDLPLTILNKNSKYRIRFTSFNKKTVAFIVKIDSNAKVQIISKKNK